MALILNCHVIRSTITPGLGSWLKLFSFAIFVFLSQGSFKSSREAQLQIRPVFVPHNLFLCGQKNLNLKHLKQSATWTIFCFTKKVSFCFFLVNAQLLNFLLKFIWHFVLLAEKWFVQLNITNNIGHLIILIGYFIILSPPSGYFLLNLIGFLWRRRRHFLPYLKRLL